MRKILKLKLPKTESVFDVVEIVSLHSHESAMKCFNALYNGISEDFPIERWNDFTFYVPFLRCIYVLQK